MKIKYIKAHVSIFKVDSISTDTLLVISTVDCSELHQGLRSWQTHTFSNFDGGLK